MIEAAWSVAAERRGEDRRFWLHRTVSAWDAVRAQESPLVEHAAEASFVLADEDVRFDAYPERASDVFVRFSANADHAKRIDAALQAVYGFDQDGLEDEWRAAHQLPPRVTPTPPAKEEASPEANGGGPGSSKSDGGTSTGTLVGVALGTLALAAAIGFAGMMLARRFR